MAKASDLGFDGELYIFDQDYQSLHQSAEKRANQRRLRLGAKEMNEDKITKGQLAAAKGAANENRFLGALLECGFNSSMVVELRHCGRDQASRHYLNTG